MLVQELRLDYVSNNLANVNTFGFKANAGAVKSFPQLLVHRLNDTYLKVSGIEGNMDLRPLVGLSTMGAVVDEIATDFQKGDLQTTGETYDFALDGKGFFVVETPYGERLTRAGNFVLNANRELVTKEGYRVMGEGGPIVVDPMRKFSVNEEGMVFYSYDNPETGQIFFDEYVDRFKIVSVDDYKTIQKKGHNLFMVPRVDTDGRELQQPYVVRDVVVKQGVLEGSNVNAVVQLRSMIDVMRIYEANSKVVMTKDTLLGKAASEIGRK